ncbi:hypothetical protein KUV85_10870 [Nocardioides panacisoli]|uniref:hypothetical protein n=1 Tax=Nocardioides panacisoli TaxID=627624 RepID=UPI001C637A6D|nr:hypothetical protein [Nocardioides panacisoli]QYJ02836.1 hypothetical protein KUV85_10870 [Nocardioides panacisoli]
MHLPTGRFTEVARHRPVAPVADCPTIATDTASRPTAYAAPSAAIELDLTDAARRGEVAAHLTDARGARLTAHLRDGRIGLRIATDRTTDHHSRRHGRARRPEALALTLTGRHLTALTREQGRWIARARVDLARRLVPHDPAWLAGLVSGWSADPGTVHGWRAGVFGQLGLRDLRLVTHANGTAYRDDTGVLLSATSAGPGFFDTAHTSLWHLDTTTHALTHRSDLWFTRPDRPGVYGDHASHVVRDGEEWLVATSTWGDFALPGRRPDQHGKPWVDVTLARSGGDLAAGTHVLTTTPLPLPTDGLTSVGVWDPHLLRTAEGWLVGFVSARKYFEFHPALAAGPDLDALSLVGAVTDRRETEGTTLVPTADGVRVLASDGPRNPRRLRRRHPVLDRDLREVGTLDAPYLSNIGWPTLVPPGPGQPDWLMVTFDGTPAGGRLAGYGTHGDVVVLSSTTP